MKCRSFVRGVLAVACLCAPLQAQCADWSTPFPVAGTFRGGFESVRAVITHDDGAGAALYIGGFFDGAGSTLARGIVRWNGTTFERVGGGLAWDVTGLERIDLGAGPQLYATTFANDGNTLLRWDGQSWAALPSFGPQISALCAFDFGSGPQIVVGTGEPGGYVRTLSPSGWTNLTPALNGPIDALEVYDAGSGPELYVSGDFDATTPGGTPVRGIARWSAGLGWVEVGGGLLTADGQAAARGYDMAVMDGGSGPRLVVVGNFRRAGGQTIEGIAAWNGSAWSGVGGGVVGTVSSVAALDLASGPKLVIGGVVLTANGVPATPPLVFDGAAWTSLGAAIEPTNEWPEAQQSIGAFAAHDDGSGMSLFVGGIFAGAGGTAAANVARWDESRWHSLGIGHGLKGDVLTMTRHDDGSGTALFAGGLLRAAGTRVVHQVARFDGTAWTPVGPITPDVDEVRALVSADLGNGRKLYATGSFRSIAGTLAQAIAIWNGASWDPLPGGGLTLTSSIHASGGALAVHDDGSGLALYVAGFFDHAGGVVANGVARWSPASGWSSVGSGLPGGNRNALAVFDDGSGPQLYAGGTFPQRIAKWNGSTWQGLPDPPQSPGANVVALAEYDDGVQPRLFVGGSFTTIGGVSTSNLAAWTGTGWQTFGDGATGVSSARVLSFLIADDGLGGGARLYAGGRFATVHGVPAAGVAVFDRTGWQSTGPGGVAGDVLSLGALDDGTGPCVYVEGRFTATDSAVAINFARYGRHGLQNCEPTTGSSYCDGSSTGLGCPCGPSGLPGHGCPNSVNPNGVQLVATGAANAAEDSVTLVVSGVPTLAPVLYLQGSVIRLGPFGDGIRCAGGMQIRLGVRSAWNGTARLGVDVAGDPLISELGGIDGGTTRYYQAWYRNSAPFCTSAGFNLSNGLEIRWAQ